jgi:tRNA(fMet)-specific endonuclease VapC
MRHLLDTNVISELIAKKPNPQVFGWVNDLEDERTYLSVITLGEIKRGIEKLPESPRKQRLQEWLSNDLLFRFRERILSIDTDVMLTWGKLVARLERRGRTLPAMDSLVAATALTYDLKLATRNEKDFLDTGVSIVNPWSF